MRKLLIGLTATLFMLLGMNVTGASAQDAPSDETVEQPTNTVDCTMLNFTPPELRTENGNFAIGSPISLELYVPKGGPESSYFVAFMDEGDPHRLNDESAYTIDWTPTEAGFYTVYGEFFDITGQPVAAEIPENCMVTLTVEVVQAEPIPVPVTETPTTDTTVSPSFPACGEPETLTLVWDESKQWYDVYNADNQLCAQVAGDQASQLEQAGALINPVPVAQPELPVTGSDTRNLTFVGIALLLLGWCLLSSEKKTAKR